MTGPDKGAPLVLRQEGKKIIRGNYTQCIAFSTRKEYPQVLNKVIFLVKIPNIPCANKERMMG